MFGIIVYETSIVVTCVIAFYSAKKRIYDRVMRFNAYHRLLPLMRSQLLAMSSHVTLDLTARIFSTQFEAERHEYCLRFDLESMRYGNGPCLWYGFHSKRSLQFWYLGEFYRRRHQNAIQSYILSRYEVIDDSVHISNFSTPASQYRMSLLSIYIGFFDFPLKAFFILSPLQCYLRIQSLL